jgi:AcrR family transcriptional regulator
LPQKVEAADGRGLGKGQESGCLVLRSSNAVLERGFEATTIADITAAADVAPRTFFSYFQTKEDVVLDEDPQRLDQVLETLRQRPPGEPLLAAFRRVALQIAAEMQLDLPALMDHAFDLLESGLAQFAAHP